MSEWITVAGATTYFSTRAGVGTKWTGLDSGDDQAYLTTAYNRINIIDGVTIPSSPTATELVELGKAQCEMALYMIIHIEDEDVRKGLQAQGVTQAGVVSESYKEDDLMNLPIPPSVWAILKKNGFVTRKAVRVVDIARDENYVSSSSTPLSDQNLET